MSDSHANSTELPSNLLLTIISPSSQAGTIDDCRTQDCGYCCCDFNEGNFIALYPGEIEEARRAGLQVDHLTLTSDESGGHRAVCHAKNRKSCDFGYKPLDCQSYPLFPGVDATTGDVVIKMKGRKCPLVPGQLREHTDWVKRQWQTLISRRKDVGKWLEGVRLVGYETLENQEL